MTNDQGPSGHPGRPAFNYADAFDRNIGWVTEAEQQALRHKRVAVAGCGGVGGAHILAMARLGIGALTISDLDQFDVVNLNRQAGATVSTLGEPKVDVLAAMARDINPEISVSTFPEGVSADNVDAFLAGADLFIDGFDFFVLDIRRRTFARCAELGIPAVTAAPIGMGAGLLVFMPGGMSFEEYFRLEGQSPDEQYLRFLMGVAPRGLHRPYLVDPSRVDLAGRRGPSTGAACLLCAGMVATEALKILLRRGRVHAAPTHVHFDAYRTRLAITRPLLGPNGPLPRLKRQIARRLFADALVSASRGANPTPDGPLAEILSLARWAPSGDNAQPWRFEIERNDPMEAVVRVHVRIDRTSVYEYRGGEPTLLSAGMLLDTMRIAASQWGRRMTWRVIPSIDSSSNPVIEVTLAADAGMRPDPLVAWITVRSVDRGSYHARALSVADKAALEEALGPDYRIGWHERAAERLALARLGMRATNIRLRIPETFKIHNSVVDWRPGPSATGIPARALGLPGMTLALMRWASRDWKRMRGLNRLGGAVTAGLQMDLLPGLASGAFFTVRRAGQGSGLSMEEALKAGERLGRMWLVAEQRGLKMHPALAILAFAEHGATDAAFTVDDRLRPAARQLAEAVKRVTDRAASELIFIARVGTPRRRTVPPRSVRRPLVDLMLPADRQPEPHAAIGIDRSFQNDPLPVT